MPCQPALSPASPPDLSTVSKMYSSGGGGYAVPASGCNSPCWPGYPAMDCFHAPGPGGDDRHALCHLSTSTSLPARWHAHYRAAQSKQTAACSDALSAFCVQAPLSTMWCMMRVGELLPCLALGLD